MPDVVSLDPRDHNWNREFEEGLPDCRVKVLERDAHKHRHGRLELDLVYCANCGELKGAVTPDCPHVFFVCDDCVAAHGEPPGAIRIAD